MSLIAHYKFEGDFEDALGNSTDGYFVASPVYATGKLAQAADFITSGNRGEVADNDGLRVFDWDSFSVSWWVNFQVGTTQLRWSIGKGNPYIPSAGWAVANWTTGDPTACALYFADNVSTARRAVQVGNSLYRGTWYNLAFTVDRVNEVINTYKNGVFVATASIAGFQNMGNSLPMMFGAANGANYTPCLMDDVRVYDHILSTKEVKELSRAKVLHYTFDDFQEPTTNLVPIEYLNGTTLYGAYNHDATGTRVHEWTADYYEGARVSHYYTGTTGYKYFALTMTGLVDGATYTFSYYAKASITTNINNLQLWRGVTDRPFTPDQNPTFTTSWKRYTGTATVSGGTTLHFFPVHGSSITGGVDLWFAGFQLEKKDHATPFVNGTRDATVQDSSGQGNVAPLALATTPTWTGDSKIGMGAYEFRQADNSIPNTPITWSNKATLSFWYKGTDTSGWRTLFCRDIGTYHHVLIQTGTREIGFYNSGFFSSGHIIPENEWHYYAIIIEQSGSWQLYVDGVNTATIISGMFNTLIYPISVIGNYKITGGNQGINGPIDDVRIYSKALTADEIREIYEVRASIDNKGNLWGPFREYYSSADRVNPALNISVLAYPYPEALNEGIYEVGGSLIYDYGRDWHISVWDRYTSDWAVGVNFYGASGVLGAHARFDLYGDTVAQSQAFVSTLQNLTPKRYIVVIGASHAPEKHTAAMDAEIVRCGGTYENLNWTTRKSYICIGSVGSGEGNAFKEVLDNSVDAANANKPYAYTEFAFEKEEFKTESTHIQGGVSEVGPTSGLVAWYKADGTANDITGITGQLSTAAAPGFSSGVRRQAYDLNGTSQWVSTPNMNFTSGDSWSIAFWVYRRTPLTSEAFLMSTSYAIRLFGNGDYTFIEDDGTYRTGSYTPPTIDAWTHYVVTFDIGELVGRIYRNGVLDATQTAIDSAMRAIGIIYFGYASGGGGPTYYYLNGKVDEMRVYNRALTASEVGILHMTDSPDAPEKVKIVSSGFVYSSGQFLES